MDSGESGMNLVSMTVSAERILVEPGIEPETPVLKFCAVPTELCG